MLHADHQYRFAYSRNSKPKLISPLTITLESGLRFNPALFQCVRDQTNTNKQFDYHSKLEWFQCHAKEIVSTLILGSIFRSFSLSLSLGRMKPWITTNDALKLFMKLCKISFYLILKLFIKMNASGRPFVFWLEMRNAIKKIIRCTNKRREKEQK